MKFKLNRAFREASGELDGLVFRNVRGKVVVARKPDMSNVVYSENQLAHRQRFKQAAAFGKAVMADANVRELYEAAAKSKNMPVFALTVADYFNAPTVDVLDLSGYNGQIDDIIKVSASDDFGVQKVHVSITDENGALIESGYAMETAEGAGLWVYVVTASVEVNVNVKVVATDRPGGTAVKTVTKSF